MRRELTGDDLERLPYTQATFCEVLRMFPPAGMVPRVSSAATKVLAVHIRGCHLSESVPRQVPPLRHCSRSGHLQKGTGTSHCSSTMASMNDAAVAARTAAAALYLGVASIRAGQLKCPELGCRCNHHLIVLNTQYPVSLTLRLGDLLRPIMLGF